MPIALSEANSPYRGVVFCNYFSRQSVEECVDVKFRDDKDLSLGVCVRNKRGG